MQKWKAKNASHFRTVPDCYDEVFEESIMVRG